MSILYPAGGDPAVLVAQLRALATDIERMGMFHPREELEDAPTLENWSIATRQVNAINGSVSGHPRLGTRNNVLTSEVFAIDKQAKWVRTFSRYYVLGQRADNQEIN